MKYSANVNTGQMSSVRAFMGCGSRGPTKEERLRGHFRGIARPKEGGFIKRIKIGEEKEEVKNNVHLSPRVYIRSQGRGT